MHIQIKATGLELTSAVENYVEKKIGALKKYFIRLDGPAVETHVEVGRTTAHHNKGNVFRAEVNLKVPGRLLRAEKEHDDLYAAIDCVHDELKRQIISFKEKTIGKRVRQARLSKSK